jgi:hypothetical protein
MKTGIRVLLRDVLYVPTFTKNLISVTRLTSQGNVLTIQDDKMTMSGKGVLLSFRKGLDTMFYLDATRLANNELVVATDTSSPEAHGNNQPEWELPWDEAHRCFGHVGDNVLESYAKTIGLKLTGTKTVCGSCAFGKAKAKPIAKATVKRSSVAGERFLIDTSGPYSTSVAGNKYWVKAVNDYSRQKLLVKF